MPCQENGFPACEARDEQVDGKGCDHNDSDLSAYIVPMSTVFDSTARGTIVLKAVDIPSIELPVIRPVPVDRIKKPTAVMTVPRIISEKDFF